jgi:hypothetical protein
MNFKKWSDKHSSLSQVKGIKMTRNTKEGEVKREKCDILTKGSNLNISISKIHIL